MGIEWDMSAVGCVSKWVGFYDDDNDYDYDYDYNYHQICNGV
jgi:hypothetical protein